MNGHGVLVGWCWQGNPEVLEQKFPQCQVVNLVIYWTGLWTHVYAVNTAKAHCLGHDTAFDFLASSRLSICPSVRMEQLGSHWKDFHENWHLRIFGPSVMYSQVSLKSDKNKGYFTWRPIYICWSYHAHFFLEWEVFETKGVEKIETQILCLVTFFRKSCRLWENVKKML
jgi:hypothetical protein